MCMTLFGHTLTHVPLREVCLRGYMHNCTCSTYTCPAARLCVAEMVGDSHPPTKSKVVKLNPIHVLGQVLVLSVVGVEADLHLDILCRPLLLFWIRMNRFGLLYLSLRIRICERWPGQSTLSRAKYTFVELGHVHGAVHFRCTKLRATGLDLCVEWARLKLKLNTGEREHQILIEYMIPGEILERKWGWERENLTIEWTYGNAGLDDLVNL